MQKLFVLLILTMPVMANAAWYSGRIVQINIGYDGSTVTVRTEGFARTDCTCYASWPNMMCLDRNRATSRIEQSMLLSAKARGQIISLYIDEASCRISAIYELN